MGQPKKWQNSFEISESEYVSLRNEMIQRILLMNAQATNAITVVLTMWAAGLGLFGIQLANLEKFNELHNIALCFGEVGAFFCSLLILAPLALKSGENLRQQVAISTYIRVFYYELIKENKIKSNNIYPWEYISEFTNDVFEKTKGRKNKLLLIMTNAEYPILGLVSFVFSSCVLLANYNFIFTESTSDKVKTMFMAVSLLVEIVEIMMILFLYKKTSINRNMTLIVDGKLEKYLKLAIDMEVMEEGDLEGFKA